MRQAYWTDICAQMKQPNKERKKKKKKVEKKKKEKEKKDKEKKSRYITPPANLLNPVTCLSFCPLT